MRFYGFTPPPFFLKLLFILPFLQGGRAAAPQVRAPVPQRGVLPGSAARPRQPQFGVRAHVGPCRGRGHPRREPPPQLVRLYGPALRRPRPRQPQRQRRQPGVQALGVHVVQALGVKALGVKALGVKALSVQALEFVHRASTSLCASVRNLCVVQLDTCKIEPKIGQNLACTARKGYLESPFES